jgi:3-oxoadipate enol-lactonase
MALTYFADLRLNVQIDGPPDGPVLVLNHALGMNLTMWDAVVPLLPSGLRILRYDHRGHGRSDAPAPPYSMGALIHDAERLLDHLGLRDCVYLGVSMGGLVAQGLAVKRLDLVRGLVLSNTAAKIGLPAWWDDRIATVRKDGLAAINAAAVQRLFSPAFRASVAVDRWADLMLHGSRDGYLGCSAAISGTDFYQTTATLTLPTLVIASDRDLVTPPDLVRETGDLILGSQFHLLRGAGHFPMIEKPAEYAAVLTTFLHSIAHI